MCYTRISNVVSITDSSMLGTAVAAEDRITLEVETHTKFSVWVSFCEIYNENIHDLLEVVPSGALRRTALRLSQDVKGNAFVKGLNMAAITEVIRQKFACLRFDRALFVEK